MRARVRSRRPARAADASPPRGRLIGGVLFVTVGLVWWQLDAWRITHGVIRWLSEYSPSRFGHGAIWTLPLSALLVGHITLAGVTVTFFVAVVAPTSTWLGLCGRSWCSPSLTSARP